MRDQPARFEPHVDDLHPLVGIAVAKTSFVGGMKVVGGSFHVSIKRNGEFVRLTKVAQVKEVFDADLFVRNSFVGEFAPALLLQFGNGVAHVFLCLLSCDHDSAHIVFEDIGNEHAQGGEDAWRGRYQDPWNAQGGGKLTGMERTSSSKGDQGEVTRVATALDGDDADSGLHVGIDDAYDA